MRILLVQPFVGYKRPNLLMMLSQDPNLTLQQLAGVCPEEYEIDAVDENHGDKIDFNKEYDIIGISCRTATSLRAYEVADKFRRKGIAVVLGGYHPTALPEEAKKHADSVVIGEAEISFPKALHDLKHEKLKPYYQSPLVDPKLIPPARRDVINYYLSTAAIEATRGCPINCDFCFVRKIKGTKYRKRPIENVIDEIKSIKQKHLMFFDSSLTLDPGYTKTLFKNMTEMNKHVSCYGNVNVLAKDEKLLKLASEAGCVNWLIGFESISQNTINNIGKTTNKVKNYMEAVKKINDYNMNVTGSFIFGFDDHVKDTFKDTLEMINELGIDVGAFNILTPFPGTPLFDRIKSENRILTYDWARYSCWDTVFKPKLMTQEELNSESNWILKEFYSVIPTIKRIAKSSRLGLYPFLNSFFRNFLLFARKFDPDRY